MNSEKNKLRCLYVGVDYISTLVGVIVFTVVRFFSIGPLQAIYDGSWAFINSYGSRLTLALFPFLMLMLYCVTGYYVNVVNKSRIGEFLNTLCCVMIGTVLFFMTVLLNDVLPGRIHNYEIFLLLFICIFLPVYFSRLLLTSLIKLHYSKNPRQCRLILLSDGGDDAEITRQAQRCNKDVVATVVVKCDDARNMTCDYFNKNLQDHSANGFLLSLTSLSQAERLKIICELYLIDRPILVTADDYRILTSKVVYDNVLSEPLMDISKSSLQESVVAMKRSLDMAGALIGIVATLPVIVALGVLIKIDSRGPIVYSQERVGYHRKPFKIYKLRSMSVDAEPDGPALSGEDDPRITRIGRFMRKYRLDELPNLWNVLRGDMSLVGPRPEREFFLAQMRQMAPYCTLLHQVRPGLTSLGMVKFGYAKSVEEMLLRLKYDLIYIQNLSLSLDLKIMFHTIRTIVKGEGL